MALETKVVIRLIGALVSAFAAWEARDRLKQRDQLLDARLTDGVMETSLLTSQGERSVRSTASVKREGAAYRLTVVEDDQAQAETMTTIEFGSRSELETYLHANTPFRMGDFVRLRR
ncbi:hypothetical protein HOP54_09000 [Halomonas daqingensis]|uniref:hypothetical protein n=1 Tax=Billgrantia desiderata TaxID=52021 RepID=UPI001F340050|nr:hypothetical protein [Halomonas desiderata]MCE8028825.1 hypothetical protein [Halomonas desiderata]